MCRWAQDIVGCLCSPLGRRESISRCPGLASVWCGVDLDTVRFLKDLFHCGVCSSSTLDLAIDWQVTDPTVSEKDQAAPYLRSIERDFVFEGRLP